jgi:hypothetical protein
MLRVLKAQNMKVFCEYLTDSLCFYKVDTVKILSSYNIQNNNIKKHQMARLWKNVLLNHMHICQL